MSNHIKEMGEGKGIISQFEAIGDKLLLPRGNGHRTNALEAFFQRMKTKETTEAFNEQTTIEYTLCEILQLFYEWLLADCYGHTWERNREATESYGNQDTVLA